MKKLLMIFITLFGLSSTIGCASSKIIVRQSSDPVMVDEVLDDTVALVKRDPDENIVFAFCTGVWVNTNVIIAAEHCTRGMIIEHNKENFISGLMDDNEKKKFIEDNTKKEIGLKVTYIVKNESTGVYREPTTFHTAEVVKVDHDHDLVMLKTVAKDTPSHHFARLAKSTPHVGDDLHIVGHVSALYWTYFRATVAAYREENFAIATSKKGPWLQVSAPIYFGNSGGGAFNYDGELVGICSYIVRAPNVGFHVHLDTIRSFLGKAVP
jgi:hypothetical protein